MRGEDWIEKHKAKYCVEKDILDRLERARRGVEDAIWRRAYSEERIEYILKTGANWSGPINDFRLVVDKGRRRARRVSRLPRDQTKSRNPACLSSG